MSQGRPAEPDRRNSFDAVRLLAALSVLLAHQFNIAGYTLPGYGQPSLGSSGPKLADAGLYVFFALSGYLIHQSLVADPRPGRFLSARVLRIYPGAVVNTLVCIAFGAVVTAWPAATYWSDAETWRFLVHNAAILFTPTQFQLPGVLADSPWPSVNVPIWTLKYEILCYLALLGFFKIIARTRIARRTALVAVAVALTAAFAYQRTFPSVSPSGLDTLGWLSGVHGVRFFTVFFCGAAYAAAEPWTRAGRSVAAVALACALLLDPVAEFRFIASVLSLGFAAIEIGKSRALFVPLYDRLGDLSYGTYLYAFPIQMLTLSRWLDDRNFWLLTLVDVALALGCACLSWRFVERPMLRLKHRRRAATPARAEPASCAVHP